MTAEEAAFHLAMFRAPKDRQVFLVFADWLQDRDDPRADGYRVIGELGLRPYHSMKDDGTKDWYMLEHMAEYNSRRGRDGWVSNPECDIPEVWFDLLTGGELTAINSYVTDQNYTHAEKCVVYPTLREALDAAALAWSLVAADRRPAARAAIADYHERRVT